ncbi:MAG: glycosyltransferase family 39 protein [Thermodesulfobacteriota bacterium]
MQYFTLIGILVVGFLLRHTYRNLPLDWDHGILGYQSYWYLKTGEMPVEGSIGRRFVIRRGWLGQNLIYLLIVKLAGTNPRKIRLFHNFYYLLTNIAVYLTAAQAFGTTTGLVAALLFAIFSSAPFYWAADECPENYLILPFTLSIYFFLLWTAHANSFFLFLSGLLGVATMLFKQNAGFYFIFYFIWILIFKPVWENLFILTSAFAIPYAAIFAYYLARKVPFEHLMATFFIIPTKARLCYILNLKFEENTQESPAGTSKPNIEPKSRWITRPKARRFKERFLANFIPHFKETSLLWWTTGVWVVETFASKSDPQNILLVMILAGVVLGFLAANKFFPYYYLPFLPIFSLCSGDFLVRLFKDVWYLQGPGLLSFVNLAFIGAVIASVGVYVFTTHRYYFVYSPVEQVKYQYRNTLKNFLSSEEISAYIKEHTTPADYIYVHSINPEIYFLSERKSVIDYVYLDSLTLGYWSGGHKEYFRNYFTQQMKQKRPKYIILIDNSIDIQEFEKTVRCQYVLEKKFDTKLKDEPDYQYKVYRRVDDERPEDYNKQGEELFNAGQLIKAKELFEKALAINPYFTPAYNNLGVLYWQSGSPAQARDWLYKGLTIDPFDEDLLVNYGSLLEAMGETANARKCFQRAKVFKAEFACSNF